MIFPKVLAMYNQDYTFKAICEECGIHVSTLRRWLREAGAPPKQDKWSVNPKPWLKDGEAPPPSIFDEHIKLKNPKALSKAAEAAHQREEKRIDEIAAVQGGPAEQYQSYMAANAVKLIRDGLESMRPPTNVRELEVVDKIARRHLGLDDKHASAANSLSIDINILNDAAAAARKQKKKKAIDVETE